MALSTKRISQLEGEYVAMFQAEGASLQEASEWFQTLLKRAHAWSQEAGTADMTAETLLGLARSNTNFQAEIDWRYSEGVREQDFQWWWGMPDVERKLLLASDEFARLRAFVALRNKGVRKEEAAARVKRTAAVFTEFRAWDTGSYSSPQHKLLPAELKQRVVAFIERQMAADPSGNLHREQVQNAGSGNALVRQQIKLGNI